MYTCDKCYKLAPTVYALKENRDGVLEWGCDECWSKHIKTEGRKRDDRPIKEVDNQVEEDEDMV